MMLDQLTLPLSTSQPNTFKTLVVESNTLLANQIHTVLHAGAFAMVYLWGQAGTGRSHYLQAACHALQQQGGVPAYVPLQNHVNLQPAMLQGLEQMALVCIDDIDQVAGHLDWETALFHCFNRCQAAGTPWLVAAHCAPNQLSCELPDLRTRLSSGVTLQVQTLSDRGKLLALQKHCAQLGLSLPDEVGRYWLHHGSRDMRVLMQQLQQLNQASWQCHRALTIPFIKSILHITS